PSDDASHAEDGQRAVAPREDERQKSTDRADGIFHDSLRAGPPDRQLPPEDDQPDRDPAQRHVRHDCNAPPPTATVNATIVRTSATVPMAGRRYMQRSC